MSRLFGIMNIEVGSDGERMQEVFLSDSVNVATQLIQICL